MVDWAASNMNGSNDESTIFSSGSWMSSEQLKEQFLATRGSIMALWETANLSQELLEGSSYWMRAKDLCIKLVDYLNLEDVPMQVPHENDMGCFSDGKQIQYMNLDLKTLAHLGPRQDEDLPDLHDKPSEIGMNQPEADPQEIGSLAEMRQHMEEWKNSDEIDYEVLYLARDVAGLFRIYPCKKPEPLASSLAETTSSSDYPSGKTYNRMGEADYIASRRAEEQTDKYLLNVERAVYQKRTKKQMDKWYGPKAYSHKSTRREILRITASVKHMINSVELVYPGPKCSSNTYAYVYPKAYTCGPPQLMSRACTFVNDESGKKKFVFYVCDTYLRRRSEMIETLVHEGSHHRTSYTTDVDFNGGTAYGRRTCKLLASRDSTNAIKNADNFCYYVQDVNDQMSHRPGMDEDDDEDYSDTHVCCCKRDIGTVEDCKSKNTGSSQGYMYHSASQECCTLKEDRCPWFSSYHEAWDSKCPTRPAP
jgi:hypothetical protein